MRRFFSSSNLFFLVGPVRSGSTVLRLMLGHHSRIARCEEFEFVASAVAASSEWPDVACFLKALTQRFDVRLSALNLPNSATDFPALADELLWRLAQPRPAQLVGAVVHNDFDQLTKLWPQAKFIYMNRDPRDVTASCVRMGLAGNTWGALPIWLRAHKQWQSLCQQLPPEQLLEVRFEALLEHPQAQTQRVLHFLGLDFEPEMMALEQSPTYSPLSKDVPSSWRQRAADKGTHAVEAELGGLLAELGYAPSVQSVRKLSRLSRGMLWLSHRWYRWNFNRRRYGLLLWLAWFLTRNWPDSDLHRLVMTRWYTIFRSHLK